MGIQHLTLPPVYKPGLAISELARDLHIDEASIIKLASNEAPLGPSRKAILAATQAVEKAHIYPESLASPLRNALAKKWHVLGEQITFGPGSEAVMALIAQAFLRKGDEAIVSQYAFITYELIISAYHGHIIKVPARHFAHDLNKIAKACGPKTRLIFLANPNNPTGTWFAEKDLIAFMEKIPPRIKVVLDEAYLEFVEYLPSYPQSVPLLAKFPNLIITRTFSKAYALAGLRVGYAISTADIAKQLERIRLPFNVSAPAIAAATAALSYHHHLAKIKLTVTQGRTQLAAGFDKLGLSYLPAYANFFFR